MRKLLRYVNAEMIGAVARTAVQVGGGVVSSRGWVNNDEWSLIGGALVTLIVTGWGVYVRRDKALIESAANAKDVETIVMTTHAAALKIPSPNVVGPVS